MTYAVKSSVHNFTEKNMFDCVELLRTFKIIP